MQIDSYQSPDAEELLRSAADRAMRGRRGRRETVTNYAGAVAFLIAATALANLASWHQRLSPSALVLVVLVWLAVQRASFPVAGGWARPTMLVFVPALFILPTPVVPLVALLVIVLPRAADIARGRVRPAVLPELVIDCWFTAAPVLVIVLAGAQRFAWSHWPVYVGALAVQLVFDACLTTGWSWWIEGIRPRVQLPLLVWLYVVDIALAPVGLLVASASVAHFGLVLLALSPIAMLWLFARERQQRMDETLALSTAYRGTALLLGDVVEADDHYTGTHSRDVVQVSVSLADRLGLDSTQKRNIEFAALLHDVGKIHVPKEIINKPGRLNEEEWAVMRRHTIDGERMLKQVGGLLADVGTIVRASHERWDGAGYPDGLVGDQIPIEARIVCTCDAFSAMTTDRPYRGAMSTEDALAELRRCAGSQFDPAVVMVIEALFGVAAAASAKPEVRLRVMDSPTLAPPLIAAAFAADGRANELVG